MGKTLIVKIGILQPGYLPWLGFFEQMHVSDVFVLYDDVQYDRQSWRNRNRIKTAHGVQWLTVPVLFTLKKAQKVYEVKIDNKVNWRKKHLSSIKQNYSKAPYYKKYIGIFEETYSRNWQDLISLDYHLIEILADCLGIKDKKIVRSSELEVEGARLERLIEICRMFKATTFYEGASGKNYIDEKAFNKQGIKVQYQAYSHPEYHQLYGGFVPFLSVIDLLFNHGDESLSILLNKSL
ncbi:MAG: WbqC family protein [bacterium]